MQYLGERTSFSESNFALVPWDKKQSDNIILRQYALDYAESIYAESEDAITNRAWTVVYFADVLTDVSSKKNINPYTYKDTIKGSWRNARKARIKRFTRENPRLKDYRFRLFDIPLFYSFLKDRGWDELSEDELKCLETVDFPVCIFNEAEISFLEKVRGELVIDYRKHLTAKD